MGNHRNERRRKESHDTITLGIPSSANEVQIKISLTCVPALGPLFTSFHGKSSLHQSSSRHNPFDSIEVQSTEGITTNTHITPCTDPYLNGTDSDPYSKFSRSQDHDSEIAISNPDKTQMLRHQNPDAEIEATYAQNGIYSSEEVGHVVGDSIARGSSW